MIFNKGHSIPWADLRKRATHDMAQVEIGTLKTGLVKIVVQRYVEQCDLRASLLSILISYCRVMVCRQTGALSCFINESTNLTSALQNSATENRREWPGALRAVKTLAMAEAERRVGGLVKTAETWTMKHFTHKVT
jgi:hypothetical protein